MKQLTGKVAVVTGASRGVGKGIALGLGEAGATVYVTGRTQAAGDHSLPGTIGETADEVSRLGGHGIAVRCDHGNDSEVEALFRRVREDSGRLDVLVNNVFSIPDGPLSGVPFWSQPITAWDQMHRVGLRSHYVASVFAAPMMVAACSGLIVHVSSFGGKHYALSVAYGVGKAAVDRMASDMAHELRRYGVAVVSLWPGIVKTERLAIEADRFPFDTTRGESPRFSGRAVAALAADKDVLRRSGQIVVGAEIAEEYGFTDLDGSRPSSLRKRPAS